MCQFAELSNTFRRPRSFRSFAGRNVYSRSKSTLRVSPATAGAPTAAKWPAMTHAPAQRTTARTNRARRHRAKVLPKRRPRQIDAVGNAVDLRPRISLGSALAATFDPILITLAGAPASTANRPTRFCPNWLRTDPRYLFRLKSHCNHVTRAGSNHMDKILYDSHFWGYGASTGRLRPGQPALL